jgi:Family of unknown function (DUF6932)
LVTLGDFAALFVTNARRRDLFQGLLRALRDLKYAGCRTVYIDGSYVTEKPFPGDYDACWDPHDVNGDKLAPVFLDFSNRRSNQKQEYGGEFFPSTLVAEMPSGRSFVEFFQVEKFTGNAKGIVSIDLQKENIDRLLEEWA